MSTKSNENANKDGAKASDNHNRILALKAKDEHTKENFEVEIKELQEKLNKQDKRIEYNEKSMQQNPKDKQGGGPKEDFANPIEILKIRVKNQTQKNKEKKRLLEQYVRNARIIQEAFETILEASGLGSYQEIVTTFIKTEEQNQALFNYINQLSQEADLLQERKDYIEQKIEHYRQALEMTDSDFQRKIDENNAHAEQLRDNITQTNEVIFGVEEQLTEI